MSKTNKNEQSTNLIGMKELILMKSNAYLVNCARGGIVNEQELLSALDSETIAGAGIDVFQDEPPGDFTLIQHPRVFPTPHIGASTVESQERVGRVIAKLIMNHLEENYLFI